MAGSFRHITNANGDFIGVKLLDGGNGWDAYEALEECWDMIQHLTGGDKQKIFEAWRDGHLAKSCPSNVPRQTCEGYWKDTNEEGNPMKVFRSASEHQGERP